MFVESPFPPWVVFFPAYLYRPLSSDVSSQIHQPVFRARTALPSPNTAETTSQPKETTVNPDDTTSTANGRVMVAGVFVQCDASIKSIIVSTDKANNIGSIIEVRRRRSTVLLQARTRSKSSLLMMTTLRKSMNAGHGVTDSTTAPVATVWALRV